MHHRNHPVVLASYEPATRRLVANAVGLRELAAQGQVDSPVASDNQQQQQQQRYVGLVVAGDQGAGKSQTLNVLSRCYGSDVHCSVGNTHHHTTLGVHAMRLTKGTETTGVIAMEIEGLESLDNDQEHDQRKIDLVAAGHMLLYVVNGTLYRRHIECMAALLEVWSERRLHLAPESARQRPHLIVAVRTGRSGPLPNYGEHFARLRHLSASIAVVTLPEISGESELGHLDNCEPERVPALMEAARALHREVARCVAAVPHASLLRPQELADIVRRTLERMYAEPAFRPADLRQQIIAARHDEWNRAQREQFQNSTRALVANPYGVTDAMAEIQRLCDVWRSAFDREWAQQYGAPADADVLARIRQAHNDDVAQLGAAVRRGVLDTQNRQQLTIDTARAAACAQLAAAHAALQLTGASRDQVDAPMNRALASAQGEFDQATRLLDHPCKARERATLTREHQRLTVLAHQQNTIAFMAEKQRLAATPASQVVLPLPPSPYLGTGNNTYSYQWKVAQLSPQHFGPGKADYVLSATASITTSILTEGVSSLGGALILNRVAGAHQVYEAVEPAGRKWHSYQATWSPSDATLTASVGSGGWGKCAGGLHKSFNGGTVTVTPNALFGSVFDRSTY